MQDMKNNPKSVKHLKNDRIIKKYLDEAKKAIVALHDEGKDTKGFTVYKTGGKKYWKNEYKKELMKKQGMTEIKLVSVSQALKKGIKVKEGKHYTLNPEIKVKYILD